VKFNALTAPAWRRSLTGLFLVALLALTWLAYTPGFSGGFLFDDFSNLPQLGNYGTIDNWESLWLYLLNNASGPSGRPLSMLSFLLDARDWPADPASFKHTNTVLHLLNGLLLFLLIRKLARALDHPAATTAALLAMALWLLHPLWVSTTLYAVQRMAQLSTLFVLLGLWLYTRTRLRHPPRLCTKTLFGTGAAIGLMGLLAVLSKENGALLPLLALTLEITVLKAHDQNRGLIPSRGFRRWRLLLLGLPCLLLVGYLATHLQPLLQNNPGIRDFTPGERWLTQGRILWDYFFHLLLPRPYTGGLFNDDIIISTGLFSPWHTVLAWGAWIAVLAWAIRNRTKRPAAALAILFFAAGHLLESSFIQLELYFEHRNYLPAALLGFPLALWWLRRPIKSPLRYLLPVGLLLILTLLTGMRAALWGQPFQQALNWAQTNPHSPRAHIYLAEQWRKTHNLAEAERLNAKALALAPDHLPGWAQRTALDCQLGKNADHSIRQVVRLITTKTEVGGVERHHLAKTVDFLLVQTCGDSSRPDNILDILQTLAASKHGQQDNALGALLAQRMGIILLHMERPEQALEKFRLSTRLTPKPGMVLKNAALLATHKAYPQALVYLDTTDLQENMPHGWSISRLQQLYTSNSGYYRREKARLREQIAKDALAAEEQQPTTGGTNIEP
jgi:tetratricopeptide (TPR) repeat protein